MALTWRESSDSVSVSVRARWSSVAATLGRLLLDALGEFGAALGEGARGIERAPGEGLLQRAPASGEPLVDALGQGFERGGKLAQALARPGVDLVDPAGEQGRKILVALADARVEFAAAIDDDVLDRGELVSMRPERA